MSYVFNEIRTRQLLLQRFFRTFRVIAPQPVVLCSRKWVNTLGSNCISKQRI